MSASLERRAQWLGPEFWDRLSRLEARHQQIQSQQEHARRFLESASQHGKTELRDAWQRYCDVIAELDQTTAEFEVLRSCSC